MAHTLDRITIRGFKSIREASLEIRPINVLISANRAGKSNFVAAFALLHDIAESRLGIHVGKRGGAASLLRFGPKVTSEIELKLDFGPNAYEAELAHSADDQLFFEKED